ncbi:MAG TPA: PQQ-binding-like beta-propeller repeat protein [Armatimonadota bacterium]|jgi:outer membrane protein assembly factor BamB
MFFADQLIRAARVGALLLLLLPLGGVAWANDWAQWRGPGRDGVSAETHLLQQWPAAGPRLLWSVDGVGEGFSQPSVTNEAIYVTGMADGNVGYCAAYNLAGVRKWRTAYGTEWTGGYRGTRSAPTVAAGRVYVTSATGELVCLNAADGVILWQQNVLTAFGAWNCNWGYTEAVLVDGAHVICTPGGKTAMLAALDARSGAVVWTTPPIMSTPTTWERNAYCSPLLVTRGATRLIVTATNNYIIGVDADSGVLRWQSAFHNSNGQVPVTPLYADGMLFVSAGDGAGSVMLQLSADGTSVQEGWRQPRLDIHFANGVLRDGFVYATGHANGGKMACVELKTGVIRWEDNSVGKGSLSYADGRLYCYAENGTLALAQPSPDAFKLISACKITLGSGNHWAHPAISNGRLFLRHGDTLMAFKIAAE